MKRIHFLVRLYDLRIHASQGIPQGTLVKPVLTMDFAKYKKFVFSHWKWKSNTHDWETSYTQSNPFYFHYRTDYAELLEPKQLIFEHGASSGANGVSKPTFGSLFTLWLRGRKNIIFPPFRLNVKCIKIVSSNIKYIDLFVHGLIYPFLFRVIPTTFGSNPNFPWKFGMSVENE